MAEKPQFYEEFKWVSAIDQIERQIIGAKTQLVSIQTAIDTIKAEVDADPESTADMTILATQAYNLVHNSNYQNLLNYIFNQLES